MGALEHIRELEKELEQALASNDVERARKAILRTPGAAGIEASLDSQGIEGALARAIRMREYLEKERHNFLWRKVPWLAAYMGAILLVFAFLHARNNTDLFEPAPARVTSPTDTCEGALLRALKQVAQEQGFSAKPATDHAAELLEKGTMQWTWRRDGTAYTAGFRLATEGETGCALRLDRFVRGTSSSGGAVRTRVGSSQNGERIVTRPDVTLPVPGCTCAER